MLAVRRRAILVALAVSAAAVVATIPAPAGAKATGGVQVQLVDPGASPRLPVRFVSPAATITRTFRFSVQIVQSGAASDTVGPLNLQLVITSPIGPAARDGSIDVPFTYGDYQLLDTSVGTPEQLDAVRSGLDTINGLGGEFRISSTGAVLSSRLNIPPDATATVRQLLQQFSSQISQLSVPLPSQPIGDGAHWRATTQLSAFGITVRQTYDYTLQNRTGNRLVLQVHYVQTAPSQRASVPGLPKGVTVQLTSFRTTGSGTQTLDLAEIFSVDAHVTAKGRQVLRAQQGDKTATINQDLRLGFDIVPQ